MSLLNVDDVDIAYGSHLAATEVTLTVAPGQTVGLLGPNGAGKSTIIHAIVGLVAPQSGAIRICGASAGSAEAKRELGFAPDDLPTPLSLTGRETIALVARLRGARFDVELAHWLAGQFDLDHALDRPVAGYSHGMRRKLQIIGAIAHRPSLLILDEPLRGLDPEAAAILLAIIEVHTASGGGLLVATHDLHSAETLCDQVTIMARGEVVGQGAPDEIRAATGQSSLADAFLVLSGLRDRVQDRRSEILRKLTVTPQEKVLS